MPSNKTEAMLRNRIATVRQDKVAEAVGLSTSQLGRIVAGENGIRLEHFESFMVALGLKIITDKEYDALRLFAARSLQESEK